MRYAKKIDSSQPSIVSALERVGAKVESLAQYGMSVDLLVYYSDRFWLMEVKNPGPPSRQKQTPKELEMARKFPIFIVTTPAEALTVIGLSVAA